MIATVWVPVVLGTAFLLWVAFLARRRLARYAARVLPVWLLRVAVRLAPSREQSALMLTPADEITFGRLLVALGDRRAIKSVAALERQAEAKAGRCAR